MLGVAGSTKGHLGYTSIYVLARQRVNATHGINNPAPSMRRLVRGVGLATSTYQLGKEYRITRVALTNFRALQTNGPWKP